MSEAALLFWLLVGHAVADYPLQGDFLAKAKNHTDPLYGVPWIHGLFWHSVIHGGAVALATGSVALGVAEVVAHMAIDYAKCRGNPRRKTVTHEQHGEDLSRLFHIDQLLHVACKVLWVILASAAA